MIKNSNRSLSIILEFFYVSNRVRDVQLQSVIAEGVEEPLNSKRVLPLHQSVIKKNLDLLECKNKT